MPERSSYAHGTPSWIDLATTDVEAAKAFYGPLMGWEFVEEDTDGGPPYVMALLDGKPAAGLMRQPPEMVEQGVPSVWTTYVTVDDVDAVAAKVPGAGGAQLAPTMDVMEAGRMAVFADPAGAPIAAWQAKGDIGAHVVNEPGAFCWSELVSPDVDGSKSFYEQVFGWTMFTGEMMDDYTLVSLGEPKMEESVAGAMAPPMPGIPPHWTVYFSVADTDAWVARATEAGATVHAPPMDTPAGKMAAISDPTGATFAVIQMAEM